MKHKKQGALPWVKEVAKHANSNSRITRRFALSSPRLDAACIVIITVCMYISYTSCANKRDFDFFPSILCVSKAKLNKCERRSRNGKAVLTK